MLRSLRDSSEGSGVGSTCGHQQLSAAAEDAVVAAVCTRPHASPAELWEALRAKPDASAEVAAAHATIRGCFSLESGVCLGLAL
eukprot:COSAG01_NODE_27559_length_682_cov_1.392796_1_plen_84_part_00